MSRHRTAAADRTPPKLPSGLAITPRSGRDLLKTDDIPLVKGALVRRPRVIPPVHDLFVPRRIVEIGRKRRVTGTDVFEAERVTELVGQSRLQIEPRTSTQRSGPERGAFDFAARNEYCTLWIGHAGRRRLGLLPMERRIHDDVDFLDAHRAATLR